jgi:hypothetical protein
MGGDEKEFNTKYSPGRVVPPDVSC